MTQTCNHVDKERDQTKTAVINPLWAPNINTFQIPKKRDSKAKKKQPKGHRCRETSPRSLSLFRLTLRCCCCQSPRVHSGGEPMLRSDPRFLEFPCYRDWIHVLLLLRLFCLKLHRFSFFCYHEFFFFMYFVVVRCVWSNLFSCAKSYSYEVSQKHNWFLFCYCFSLVCLKSSFLFVLLNSLN